MIGPSGVGKTECAKVLSELLYGRDSFVRLDMTEYAEPHSVARLIGAPPGYAGYGEGGLLTERIRRRPYSLVLFDELEKAHPEVRALLLQILEEGKLTDSSGTAVSFRNAAVVMTANSGEGAPTIGFAQSAPDFARTRAEMLLSKELVDRTDEVVFFSAPDRASLERIAQKKLQAVADRLRDKNISVVFDDKFVAAVLRDTTGGVREVCRRVERHAEELISRGILSGTIAAGRDVLLTAENGQCAMRVSRRELSLGNPA